MDQKTEHELSRIIGAVGKQALIKMRESSVLLVGLKGLGIETAKNVVLMGVKNLSLLDTENVAIADLSSNFFLTEADLGNNRATACQKKLQELNERVTITVLPPQTKITLDLLKPFQMVVMTNNRSMDDLIAVNNLCRQNNAKFIAADVRGLFASIFVDFGDTFTVSDKNGEKPRVCHIEYISKEPNAVLTIAGDNSKHDLEDGDTIKITSVKGMTELNGTTVKVTIKGPKTLYIGDTTAYGEYLSGGVIEEIKVPVQFKFSPLQSLLESNMDWESVLVPPGAFIFKGEDIIDMRPQLLLFYRAILKYHQSHNALPSPLDEVQADEVVSLAKQISEASPDKVPVNEEFVKKLALVSSGELGPLNAAFGGVVAQEVMKGLSHQHTPIKQWVLYHNLECLPKELPPKDDYKLSGTRYDGQISVFGNTLHQKVTNLKYFLVGSGAIGCEILKNWAMMGVGTGADGEITVTDPDTIEISNLNRQFLYRGNDVNKLKAEVAAKAVKVMNPALKIKTSSSKVCPETEDKWHNKFWNGLDGVCAALDNYQARMYVDSKCVFHKKPMLESGTLGTKGHTQIAVPFLTETYGSSVDPPEESFQACLIHSYPNIIEHCLQWARELLFEGWFVKDPESVNNYIQNPDMLESLRSNSEAVASLLEALTAAPKSLEDCIKWARIKFETLFNHDPKQWLHSYPEDAIDASGALFWSGLKKPPHAIDFDVNVPEHLAFVTSAAFMRAYSYGLLPSEHKPGDLEQKMEYVKKFVGTVQAPPFVPKQAFNAPDVKRDPNAPAPVTTDLNDVQTLIDKVPKPSALGSLKMHPTSFEKDDDTNFHIDFVWAAGCLRAKAYNIAPVDRLEAKLIAGRIIPAIVTTTAMVSGFICLEMYKWVQSDKVLTDYRNTWASLGVNSIMQSEAVPPSSRKWLGKDYTVWDRIDIKKGDLTLHQVLGYFKKVHGLSVEMLTVEKALVYASFWPPEKKKERFALKMSEAIATSSKKAINTKVTPCVRLDISAPDPQSGKDIIFTPPIWFYFADRKKKQPPASADAKSV